MVVPTQATSGDAQLLCPAKLELQPLDLNLSLKDKVYQALKDAILSMNIYSGQAELRLDERQLSADLGVSRTPVREAFTRLEQEGFVRIQQRRGVFVVRKSKQEILEMISVWAALEGMAARLATANASAEEIQDLRRLFVTFENNKLRARIDEYSEANIRFHQQILQMSKNRLIVDIAENLFAHMRPIRRQTIGEGDRVERSIIDHLHIIEALEKRDADLAEKEARQHTLALAEHVERHARYLD